MHLEFGEIDVHSSTSLHHHTPCRPGNSAASNNRRRGQTPDSRSSAYSPGSCTHRYRCCWCSFPLGSCTAGSGSCTAHSRTADWRSNCRKTVRWGRGCRMGRWRLCPSMFLAGRIVRCLVCTRRQRRRSGSFCSSPRWNRRRRRSF